MNETDKNESTEKVDAETQAAIDAFEKGFKGEAVNAAADVSKDAKEEPDAPAPDTAAEAPAPAPKKKEKTEAAPAPAVEEDPYAGLDPRVRDALAKLATKDSHDRQQAGVVKKLESQLAKALKRLDELGQPAAPVAAPAEPALQKIAAIEKVRGELPEVAEAFDEALKAVNAAQKRSEPTPAPVPQPSVNVNTPDQGAIDAATAKLAALYPDWNARFNDANFNLWLPAQGASFQDEVLTTNDPMTVAMAFKKYDEWKAARAPAPAPAPSPNARADARAARAAAAPAAGARGAVSRTMTPEEAFEFGFKNPGG